MIAKLMTKLCKSFSFLKTKQKRTKSAKWSISLVVFKAQLFFVFVFVCIGK